MKASPDTIFFTFAGILAMLSIATLVFCAFKSRRSRSILEPKHDVETCEVEPPMRKCQDKKVRPQNVQPDLGMPDDCCEVPNESGMYTIILADSKV